MRFIVTERSREYEFLLTPGLYIVGRDPTCDLTLDSRNVSRRHMSCQVSEDGVEVKDLGSRNSVTVGGVEVKSASLKDGDQVRVGDVRLHFVAGPQPAGAPAPEPPTGAAVEGTLEDQEATPQDGVSVPQVVDELGGPQLLERDGRWFVADPVTGREVEIVPATQGRPAHFRLLATKKGKIIVGAAAGVVALLLLVAIILSVTGGGESGADGPMSSKLYQRYMEEAVQALDAGDTQKAKGLATTAARRTPSKGTAGIILELASRWDGWRADFFKDWDEVDRCLKDLYRYESSKVVRGFVDKYRNWIRQEVAYAEAAAAADKELQAGDYEEAWQKLDGIPEGSPVRARDAALFSRARAALHKHLEEVVEATARQRNWQVAAAAARKLGHYFPDQLAVADARVAEYTAYRAHAKLIQSAKRALADQDFVKARRQLAGIPDHGPYSAEAKSLADAVRTGQQYAGAFSNFTNGNGEKALDMLAGLDTPKAASLRRNVESVLGIHAAAMTAQKTMDLVEAERQWTELVNTERDDRNAYRQEAVRRLRTIRDDRMRRANDLVRRAGAAAKQGEFEKARELYQEASRIDPNASLGDAGLARLTSEGVNHYRLGLNQRGKDPKEALRHFDLAVRMLAADHRYYHPARSEKEKIENRAGEQGTKAP